MSERIYRFAEFELLPAVGELRRGESSLRLQEKPLQLLLVLLENPQRLVSREQLRERMWGNETFVDYEHGINVAIMKLRDALGDSAENPRLIQTVAKKGYRFRVPVEFKEESKLALAIRPIWLIAAIAALIFAALGAWLLTVQGQSRHPRPIQSLAVLPLRDLSPDPGQEYLADGITEDLITNLAQSLPLRVTSRTSVMRYKQTNEPITQIARELGVEAIVEGAVARSGDQVTVTVQLIDATEDRHLWAQKYQRKIEDLLAVQADLSEKIANQIGGTLNSQRQIKAAKSRPVDPQVYELCLLGRYQWNKRTPAGLLKAIEYFQKAISLDPGYAPAYAGLANAYVILPHYGNFDLESSYAKGAAAARQALALDDSLAEAHATLGFIAVNHWSSAAKESEYEFRRALELNPNYATAHHWFAFDLMFSGHSDKAVREVEFARQLDPLSAIVNADAGEFLYAADRDAEARTRLQQAIELAPDLGQPHETLALIDLENGQSSEAVREARLGLKLDPKNPRTLGEAGFVLAAAGHADEARRLLAILTDQIRLGRTYGTLAALIDMGLGERNQALDILEKSTKLSGVHALDQWRSVFAPLRDDPRYQKLTEEEAN
jgi:TolB-like protein/DNA-binding winged helix-turn-helix (wHTH) protein/Tfp pilus assembly protein PilF